MATTPKPAATGKDGQKPADGTTDLSKPSFSNDDNAAKDPTVHEREADHDRYPASDDASDVVGFGHNEINPATASVKDLEGAKVDTTEADSISELPPRKLYNPNTGLRPRVGGPYLDQLELEQAERTRAVFEGREPNYDDMAGTAGVPLMTAGQVANLHGGNAALADFIDDNADNEKLGPRPVTEVPFAGENLEVVKTSLDEARERREWDNTKVSSHDQPGVVFSDPTVSAPATGDASGTKARDTEDDKTKTKAK